MTKAEVFCHAIDAINKHVGMVICYLTLPLLAFVVTEVVLRYVFNRPTIWVWDVNVQLLAVLAIMGSGHALFAKTHVTVDVIVSRLSPRKRAIVDLITAFLFFFCIGTLVWQGTISGWRSVVGRESYTSVWAPPIYPLKMLVPVGAFLLLLQGIANFIRNLKIVTHAK